MYYYCYIIIIVYLHTLLLWVRQYMLILYIINTYNTQSVELRDPLVRSRIEYKIITHYLFKNFAILFLLAYN